MTIEDYFLGFDDISSWKTARPRQFCGYFYFTSKMGGVGILSIDDLHGYMYSRLPVDVKSCQRWKCMALYTPR